MTISAQDDLCWLAECYHAELGFRSGGGSFENALMGLRIVSGQIYGISQRAANAAARAQLIIRAVNALSRRHRKVLISSYDPGPNIPMSYRANYGDDLAGIVRRVKPPKSVVGQEAVLRWARTKLTQANSAYMSEKRLVDADE